MYYSKEEIQIMNLDDNYTLLYPFLVKSLIEHFGEQGEKTAREGTRRFGRDRAETLRNKHLNAGVKINMHSLFAVGPDLPPDPRFKRELQELNQRSGFPIRSIVQWRNLEEIWFYGDRKDVL